MTSSLIFASQLLLFELIRRSFVSAAPDELFTYGSADNIILVRMPGHVTDAFVSTLAKISTDAKNQFDAAGENVVN